jgi:hypothetical protein
MKSAAFFASILLAATARADACELTTAAASWKNGDIEDALACAQDIQPANAAQADSKSALLTAIAFVKGQYSGAISTIRRSPAIQKTSSPLPSSPRRPPTFFTISLSRDS